MALAKVCDQCKVVEPADAGGWHTVYGGAMTTTDGEIPSVDGDYCSVKCLSDKAAATMAKLHSLVADHPLSAALRPVDEALEVMPHDCWTRSDAR
jgi:hypothetical protein